MSQHADQRRTPDETPATPVMSPDEIRAREEQMAETLPPPDQESVERSAGEGMVSTPVEAATIPTEHVSGRGRLLDLDGRLVAEVMADLQLVAPTWAGTLTVAHGEMRIAVPGRYRLQLDDGRRGHLTVTHQAGAVYTVEGEGQLAMSP